MKRIIRILFISILTAFLLASCTESENNGDGFVQEKNNIEDITRAIESSDLTLVESSEENDRNTNSLNMSDSSAISESTSAPTAEPTPSPTASPTPKSTQTPEPTEKPTPAPTEEASSTASTGDNDTVTYNWVLNTNTKKVHYPNCKSVSQIKEKNYATSTLSPDELKKKGYSPCGNCKPFPK